MVVPDYWYLITGEAPVGAKVDPGGGIIVGCRYSVLWLLASLRFDIRQMLRLAHSFSDLTNGELTKLMRSHSSVG